MTLNLTLTDPRDAYKDIANTIRSFKTTLTALNLTLNNPYDA